MNRLVGGALALVLIACAFAAVARPASEPAAQPEAPREDTRPATEAPESMLAAPIRWRRSRAIGRPYAGRLVRGVQLPSEGEEFFTWDPIRKTVPNRGWRRYGTDRLVRVLLSALREYRAAHPSAPRVGIGDLSRPSGGDFGPRFGAPGHASHQNGLDVDVYYPRTDGRERGPMSVGQVDRALARDLVDRFVSAGARFVFVGLSVGLHGKRKVVQAIPHHDNHMHVRLWPR
jgi:murein endopeptidase